MTPNSIEAEGLVKQFRKGPRAVDGIDLHVSPGEIYGFLGPNGAGKSTTVHMLTTLLPPTEGTARVLCYDVVRDARQVRRRMGAVLADGRSLKDVRATYTGTEPAKPPKKAGSAGLNGFRFSIVSWRLSW